MKIKKTISEDSQKIEQALTDLYNQEIDGWEEELSHLDGYEFSREHQQKMQRIFRECGTKTKVVPVSKYRALRRVAAVFIVLCVLGTAGTVSASVFDFHPWRVVTSYFQGTRTTTYNRTSESEAKVSVKKVSNIPQQIPAGYIQRECKDGKDDVVATWQNEQKQELCYSQLKIVDGMVSKINTSRSKEESIMIAKYKADVIYEGDEVRLDWNDEKYTYFLYADGLTRDELRKVAESIYQVK